MGHQEEGERGGEGGRGGEGAGQKPSPAHHRKGKNGGAMYLVKSKDLHLSGGKNQPTCVFLFKRLEDVKQTSSHRGPRGNTARLMV